MVSSIACFLQVLKDGSVVGAAVLGVPAKATIKEVTIPRLIRRTHIDIHMVCIVIYNGLYPLQKIRRQIVNHLW